jgi:hypothetical protein
MSIQGYTDLLARSTASGTAIATSTTRTSLTPAHARFTTPAGNAPPFWYVGKELWVYAFGQVSTFTSGTLTLTVGAGAVDIASTGALTMVASQTNQAWMWEVILTLQTEGAGGSATAQCRHSHRLDCNAAYTGARVLPATAPALGTAFDPAAASVLDIFATWSVSNAANSIQLLDYHLAALN